MNNSLEEFLKGKFYIKRGQDIIQLEKEEIQEIEDLLAARDGHRQLEYALEEDSNNEYDFASKYLYDEQACSELQNRYYSSIADGYTQLEVTYDYLKELKED